MSHRMGEGIDAMEQGWQPLEAGRSNGDNKHLLTLKSAHDPDDPR